CARDGYYAMDYW
nr:immunoglobulin heavy chain junction region [Mus musculus]